MAEDTFDTELVSAEERLHQSKISQNYMDLINSASPAGNLSAPVRDPEENFTAPANGSYAEPEEETQPAFVHSEITADNAARLADYTAYPAPAEEGKKILFEGAQYTRGGYITGQSNVETADRAFAPEGVAEAAAPVFAPAFENREEAAAPEVEAEDDALPTARTMLHRTKTEDVLETDDRVGFWASVSVQTKLLIAAVFTAIVVAVLIVCVNTATIGRVSAEIAEKQSELAELQRQANEIEDRLEEVTDPAYVDQWAQQHGMVKN